MALTRTIPLKDLIFTADTLNLLLKELSRHYRKSKDAYSSSRYELEISQDENTTVSIDSPPKAFEPLLGTRVHFLSLTIKVREIGRSAELTIYHGATFIHNRIVLRSEDEDWVNLTHSKLTSILKDVEPQSTFLRRYLVPLFISLDLALGWILNKVFLYVLLWTGQAKLVPWTWTIFGQHVFVSLLFGVIPASALMGYMARAYPSVEIQTGPSRQWKEANLR